jgi:hypothetical protein
VQFTDIAADDFDPLPLGKSRAASFWRMDRRSRGFPTTLLGRRLWLACRPNPTARHPRHSRFGLSGVCSLSITFDRPLLCGLLWPAPQLNRQKIQSLRLLRRIQPCCWRSSQTRPKATTQTSSFCGAPD